MILRLLNCESAFSFIETEFYEGRINDATLQSAADLIEECDLSVQVGELKDWLDQPNGLIEWNKRRDEVMEWTGEFLEMTPAELKQKRQEYVDDWIAEGEPSKDASKERFRIGSEYEYSSADEMIDAVDYEFIAQLLKRFASAPEGEE